MTPAWILDIFAAIMLAVAAISAARLVAARPWQHGGVVTDTDISHLLMGIAMAGMLAPSLTTLPNDAWVGVFAVLMIWFGYRVARDYQANGARALAVGHCAPHLVHSAAMVYMFAAITTSSTMAGMSGMGAMSGMSGMSSLHVPTLALLFAAILIGYTVWDLDQLSSLRSGLTAAVAATTGPRLVPAAAGAPAAGVGLDAAESSAGGAIADSPDETTGTADQGAVGGGRSRSIPFLDAPGTVVGCRIAMGVTMALMLILMI